MFKGKAAFVTGAASGIGRATACAFAEHGASVAICDTNDDGLRATAAEIEGRGGRAIYQQLSITDGAQLDAFIARAVREFGKLDCAANVAAVQGPVGPLTDIAEDAFRATLEVNVLGIWQCMRAEISAMLAHGGGNIVNVASCAGIRGFARLAAYTASKHAVVGITRSAALEYARQNIRVNAICPGFTLTGMIAAAGDRSNIEAAAEANPSGRVAQPEEQANAILYLCSNMSTFVNGQALAVDGGQTVQPAQPPRRAQ